MADFRMQLSSTDYGNFLANEPLPLSTATIADKVSRNRVPAIELNEDG
jgi:V-type H+-transporting ATPase subunit d